MVSADWSCLKDIVQQELTWVKNGIIKKDFLFLWTADISILNLKGTCSLNSKKWIQWLKKICGLFWLFLYIGHPLQRNYSRNTELYSILSQSQRVKFCSKRNYSIWQWAKKNMIKYSVWKEESHEKVLIFLKNRDCQSGNGINLFETCGYQWFSGYHEIASGHSFICHTLR